MMLNDRVAVIYGAGGSIGGTVARAFAAEGAKVFLTGRARGSVDAVAREIAAAGGCAEVAEVDALDERAVDEHLRDVVGAAGRVDVSFNAVGLPNAGVLGTPLVEMDAAQFSRPVTGYATSYFLTARAAARQMIQQRSGVIMTVTALPARLGTRLNGGYGSAQAAKEALTRDLSAELAPHGIRVVGLRPHGIPGTRTMTDVFELKPTGMSLETFHQYLVANTHTRRVMTLADVGGMAAFMASDRASGMTGTTVNLTMGSVDD